MENILFQLIANGIIIGSIYALIASGFSLVYNIQKFINIAHGGIYVVAAFLAYYLTKESGLGYLVGIPVALLLCPLLSIIIDYCVYQRLEHSPNRQFILLIASFGVFIFLQSIVLLFFGGDIYSYGLPAKIGYNLFGIYITKVQLLIIFVTIVIFVLLYLLLMKTKIGKTMRAVADDKVISSTLGVNVSLINMITFAIGSVLAGIAGILISFEQNLEYSMGLMAVLKGITASIIAGIGNVQMAIFGGLLLGIVENIGILYLPTGYKDAIAFAILILFLFAKPQGLFGFKKREEIAG